MIDWDFFRLSDGAEAVRAELMLRGVIAVAERNRTPLVTAPGEELAEDFEKVVVAAFKCSPRLFQRGPDKPQLDRVLVDGDLDGRPVIDALTGEVLPQVRTPPDTRP